MQVASVSYDSIEILADFARRRKITFPMLSDPQSEVIRRFGILNDSIAPGERFYGIPYPGSYLVDASGVVKAKYFEPDYRERFSAGTVLVREFGAVPGEVSGELATPHLRLTFSASARVLRPGQRITLVLDLEMPPGMHVYTPEVGDPYIPVDWQGPESAGWKAEPVAWPPPRILHLPAIDETVPVYEGKVRIVRDVLLAQQRQLQPLLDPRKRLAFEATFRYQACDDRVCYPPRTLDLTWTLPVEMHDPTRAPEAIRHKL